MEEQVFFIINGDELVLDKVLVEYNEAPIFCVCKYEEKYFVASCVNLEEERYIVTGVSLNSISKMLHGKITMRELVLQTNMFWDIIVGEDASKDIVEHKNIDEIPLEALPYEGAYLKIVTKDLEKYVEEIDAVLYGEGVWEDESVQGYVECVENLLENLYEQYENMFQGICDWMVETASKNIENVSGLAEIAGEVFNSGIQIEVENPERNRVLVGNGKYPFAA